MHITIFLLVNSIWMSGQGELKVYISKTKIEFKIEMTGLQIYLELNTENKTLSHSSWLLSTSQYGISNTKLKHSMGL